jgi:hypothetical protein
MAKNKQSQANNTNNMMNKDANKQDTSANFSTNQFNTNSKASQSTKGNEGIPIDESMKIVEDTGDKLKNPVDKKIDSDPNLSTVTSTNQRLQTGQGMTGQDTDYRVPGERSQDQRSGGPDDQRSSDISDAVTEENTDPGVSPSRSDKVKA